MGYVVEMTDVTKAEPERLSEEILNHIQLLHDTGVSTGVARLDSQEERALLLLLERARKGHRTHTLTELTKAWNQSYRQCTNQDNVKRAMSRLRDAIPLLYGSSKELKTCGIRVKIAAKTYAFIITAPRQASSQQTSSVAAFWTTLKPGGDKSLRLIIPSGDEWVIAGDQDPRRELYFATGFGDAVAVYRLGRVFERLRISCLDPQPSYAVDPSELRHSSLVLIGGPYGNAVYAQLDERKDFGWSSESMCRFELLPGGTSSGSGYMITCRDPSRGPWEHLPSIQPHQPPSRDYALIRRWCSPFGTTVLGIAGCTNRSTCAAVDFLTSDDKLRQLEESVGTAGLTSTFDAVISVGVSGSTPFDSVLLYP